ncbi:FtsW/RodA/SpoVE family cell cycle protein [Deinococcus peraridilitoris]|uniref:Bacterial cell division membrane protein n=1 Tax=Deinococcus peraridilitoris (strain DSM 19664 / LMG 22246 / CIP 109416 / KR-200) TaxID=937777 RepID=K9ZX77_DEIPD|nr:FtsW/RodA/SpoVE family cell cycle protein [Deinococcus peraridilitoris]AFZ65799.1 bacterial cell division membrane protein [Deinococcus peraridilitoris DSM 19664]
MSLNLVIAQCLLLMLGLIGVATAEPNMVPDHATKILIALALTFVLSRLRPKAFLKLATPFWIFSLALLALVLFIGVGGEWGGGRRWLDFGGPVRFQPSEFAKLALVLQLASFFARRGPGKKLLSATMMIVTTTLLVLLEPDLGTTVLVFSLGIVLMYAAGVRFTSIGLILAALTLFALPFASIYLEKNPYILERIRGHQESKIDARPEGATQIDLAHRDMRDGGVYGQGPDAPKYYLPAGHTDMVIASVGFSTGLLGVATIIFAYWLIVQSGLSAAEWASRIRPLTPELHGASIMATGAMFMIVGQAFVNLAVAVGVFPVTGVPLPLVSYGFSSLLAKSVAFAVMHSALREVHRHLPGKTPETIPAAGD